MQPDTSGEENEKPQATSKKHARNILYARILAFCVIEVAFVTLAAECLPHPIVLKFPFWLSNPGIAHGFTVTSILWQTLAIIAVEQIITDAFSKEWTAQRGDLVPGAADRVSTITSSFLDRTTHLFAKRASGTFKFSFLASFLLLALTKLAPGTISAVIAPVDILTQIQVGTWLNDVTNIQDFFKLDHRTRHAAKIVYMEQVVHSPIGLQLPPNHLLLYPAMDIDSLNGTFEYKSDIVKFHYDCHWEAPHFSGNFIVLAGQTWALSQGIGSVCNVHQSIIPLYPSSFESANYPDNAAFLFIGGNKTFRDNSTDPPRPRTIDLGTLPATFVTGGVRRDLGLDDSDSLLYSIFEPLASLLICDPHSQISGGLVRVSLNGTLNIINSGQPRIGNFQDSATNIIFGRAFIDVLRDEAYFEFCASVGNIVGAMFMSEPWADWYLAKGVPPSDIATINKNMDSFMLSAAKGFIGGQTYANPTDGHNVMTIPATQEQPRLVLTTSKEILIAVIVVFVLTLLLLCTLCKSAFTEERRPFDLESVMFVLQANNKKSLVGSESPDVTS